MWIARDAEAPIQQLVSERPVVLLTGARQTGKTSLLTRLFPKHKFVSLDLPSAAEQAEKTPEEFLETSGSPLIIDEIQYAPRLFRYLKLHIDKTRQLKGRCLL